MIRGASPELQMEIVSDPQEVARLQVEGEQLDRNLDWFDRHAAEIYRQHRGKCFCVAGEELFVANTSPEAIAKAKEAHPEDQGWFIGYIPREKMLRIYANRR
jgi:hypothetical protein